MFGGEEEERKGEGKMSKKKKHREAEDMERGIGSLSGSLDRDRWSGSHQI